jgi:hypothetical protein
MALNPTVLYKWQDDRNLWVLISCVPTGNYATSGDTLSFTAAGVQGIQSPVTSFPTACVSGNHVAYIPGASRDVGKVRYNVAAGTEKTNASAYSNDSFVMLFVFPALT